eukprot:1064171-Rhodomonas_salina.2
MEWRYSNASRISAAHIRASDSQKQPCCRRCMKSSAPHLTATRPRVTNTSTHPHFNRGRGERGESGWKRKGEEGR